MPLNSCQIVKWRLELVKKKIKDLTLAEIQMFCKKHKKCKGCAMRKWCVEILVLAHTPPWDFDYLNAWEKRISV